MMQNCMCKAILQITDSALLQHDLDNLQICSLENHLDFNISKCVSFSMYRKYDSIYSTDSQHVPQLDFHHNLGFLLYIILTWNTHLDFIKFLQEYKATWSAQLYFYQLS